MVGSHRKHQTEVEPMKTIEVHRYPVPSDAERASWPEGCACPADRYQGYVQDADATWILFIRVDGGVEMFDKRHENGGIITDIPNLDHIIEAGDCVNPDCMECA
jgi:hypothetical protein